MSTFRVKLRVKEWKWPVIMNPPLPIPQFPAPPPLPPWCGHLKDIPPQQRSLIDDHARWTGAPVTMWGSS